MSAQQAGEPAERSTSRVWLVIAAIAVLVAVGVTLGAVTSRDDSAPAVDWFANDGSGIAYAIRVDAGGDAAWVCQRSSRSELTCATASDGPVDIDEGSTSWADVVGGVSGSRIGVGLVIRHDRAWYCFRIESALLSYHCASNR